MKRLSAILSLLMLCVSFNVHASGLEAVVEYDGSESKELTLSKEIEVTRYRTVMRDSTCTRSEPYEDQVCEYETRYRNECNWVPGQRVCRSVPDRTCRNVTRYRQSCSTGPSRQVCRNEPGQRVCRTRNGQQVCRDVPGRRVCRSEPGQRTCRQVPYTDTVCTTTNRTVCDTTPGRNVCRDVPYQDYVCRNVTRYRDVTYACQKPEEEPYQAKVEYKHEVKFNFQDKEEIGAASFDVKAVDDFLDVITNNRNEESYIQLEKSTEFIEETDDEILFKSDVNVTFGSIEKLLRPLSVEIKKVRLNNDAQISIESSNIKVLEGQRIDIVVAKKNNKRDILFGKTFLVEDLYLNSDGVIVDLKKAGFENALELAGQDVMVSIRVIVEPPRRLVTPIGESLTLNKDFDVVVDYSNFELVLAPFKAVVSDVVLVDNGELLFKTNDQELLKKAKLKLAISEIGSQDQLLSVALRAKDITVVDSGLMLNLKKLGLSNIEDLGGAELKVKLNVEAKLPAGVSIPDDVEINKVHKFNIIVGFANIDEIMAPVRVSVKKVKMNKKGLFLVQTSDDEKLAQAVIDIVIKEDGEVIFSKEFSFDDFELKDGLFIDLSNHGFEELGGVFSRKLNVDFSVSIVAPRGFEPPAGESLTKTHSFKIKVKRKL